MMSSVLRSCSRRCQFRLHLSCRRSFSVSSPATQSVPTDFDIVVVGGGVAGLTFACSLLSRTKRCRIAVVDGSRVSTSLPPLLPSDPPNVRVVSLSPKSIRVIRDCGAAEYYPPSRMTAFTHMRVSDALSIGRVDWSAREVTDKSTVLGFTVETNILTAALSHRLAQFSTATVIDQSKVSSIEYSDTSRPLVNITSANGSKRQLCCRLLVGSDGAQSLVKMFAGISSTGYDYTSKAITATVRTEQPHTTAWQVFLPTGPLALLPCHGHYSNIVWSAFNHYARHISQTDPQTFISDINNAFRSPPILYKSFAADGSVPITRLFPILFPNAADPPTPPLVVELSSERLSFPLRRIEAERAIGKRVAIIGDAAHVIHPLAGQSLNTGINEADQLANAVANALTNGGDIGTMTTLTSFENAVARYNRSVSVAVDTFHHLYSSSHPAVVTARGIGMTAFNAVAAAKRYAAQVAMGL